MPKRPPFYLCIITLLLSTGAFSQVQCGFDELHRQKIRTDINYRRFVENFERQQRQKPNASSRDNSNVIDTITVVVHIIHTGDPIGSKINPADEKIIAAIDYANQVYAGTYPGIVGAGDLGIRFALAKRDPNCNATTGIDRTDGSVLPSYVDHGVGYSGSAGVSTRQLMDLVQWDPYRYYNIWVVNVISTKPGDGVGGFAYLPYSILQDGIFITAESMHANNPTLPHELGHSLFLYHVFEGSTGNACTVNSDCANDGDHICDTDPVTKPAGEDRSGINPCTNTSYNANTESNFMNYTGSKTLFTVDQRTRMKQTIVNNILRDTLVKSLGRFAPHEATVCSFTIHLDGAFNENNISLHWQQGGVNGKGYYIERSYDGTHFNIIATIAYNASVSGYSFNDPSIAQQKNYYRVKQVISAQINYSNTVVIDNPITKSDPLVILNNPARDYIDMQFGVIKSLPGNTLPVHHGTAEIRLIDMSGRILYRNLQAINEFQRFRIPVNNIAPGVYILQVWVNKGAFSKKVVVIR